VTEPPSLATFFNRWKKAQTTVTLLVDVPKEEREQALVVFAARGWKVINR
jgi:hypothetical protein